ncbi:MAG: OmpA family protein [Rhodospirillaceae bacterium]|nr:OmpA family protein [Rhodospirillaceae bacterium]
MKKTMRALLSASAITALTTAAAFAAPEGPYFSFGGGLSLPEDSSIDLRVPVTTAARSRDITFDMGYILSGAVGYRWDSGFRTELEANYRESSINDLATSAATGRQKVIGVMTNLLYDLGNSDSFFPYVGGGIGVAWNKWDNVQGSPNATFPFGTPAFHERDTSLQWQGIAGLSHPFTERVDGFVEYRYIGTFNNKFHSIPAGSTASRHDDRSHNLLVGIRFNFGVAPQEEAATASAAAAPPPPPPPPPPAPPPPPPVPQKFLVFFDFDRANLRADASKIVGEAADYAKKNGKARITATGHADTSGSPAYNIALSERRAKAVKAALLNMGFNDSEVVVLFKGESEPLVATGDGVKEPQNRRVEIVME